MHAGQVRKFTGLPYLVHCDAVASIASLYDPDAIEVAYLHDTLEDTEASYDDLVRLFDKATAEDVLSLTSVGKSAGNRRQRKKFDNAILSLASPRAQTVKLADILDNVPSMMVHDPKFGIKYLSEKLATIDVLTRANPNLLSLSRDYLRKLKAQYGGV